MIDERALLERFRVDLELNHIGSKLTLNTQLRMIGDLTQKTLRKKLAGPGLTLTPVQRAEAYTLWLREQRPSAPRIHGITVEYCQDLWNLELDVDHVLKCWNDCTQYDTERFAPAEDHEQRKVMDNIDGMRRRIETCFRQMKQKESEQTDRTNLSRKPKMVAKKNLKKNVDKKSKAKTATAPDTIPTKEVKLDLATISNFFTPKALLSSVDVYSTATFGQQTLAPQGSVNTARPHDQNRNKENARLTSNSQRPNLTGANAEPTAKIHPMFRFQPRPYSSPILPPRTTKSASSNSLPLPLVIDLTQPQRNSETSHELFKDFKYRLSTSLSIEDDSEEDMRELPKSYVCKRCDAPGHHIKKCPTLHDKKFDSKPGPEYACHACGLLGDHFITSCPKRDPGFYLKKKSANLVLEANDHNDSKAMQASSTLRPWTETGFAPQGGPCELANAEATDGKTSGHVRKRSDDVEYMGERKRRLIDSYISSERDEPTLKAQVKEVKLRERLPKEGRLTPCDNDHDDDVDMGLATLSAHQVAAVESLPPAPVSAPPNSHGSRAGLLAELEADTFLAELEQEQELEKSTLPTHVSCSSLGNLLPKYDLPVRSSISKSIASNETSNERPFEYTLEERENIAESSIIEDPSSPVTPRSPPAIEFYVTPKSLYSPSYDLKILALFQNNPNVWIRKDNRPTASDMWCTPEDRVNEHYEAVDGGPLDTAQPESTPPPVHSTDAEVASEGPVLGKESPTYSTRLADVDMALDTMARR